jgi:putative membrane protein
MAVLEIFVYLMIGLVAMMTGYLIIDLIIPADFPKEIQEGNKAVGWVSAGIYAGLGFIIRSAIISFNQSEVQDLLQGVISTAIYAVVGIAAFIIGYFLVDIVNKKFNFNVEISNKNEAAGIMIFGIFMGVAFIVSGVIQ